MRISNQQITLETKPEGAELTSIIRNETGQEYLWQADRQHWNRHAPVLFPIVGKLKNDSYRVNDKFYSLGQHGFARDERFNLVQESAGSLLYQLTSSPGTRGKYPFDFRLQIGYVLTGDTVETHCTVYNEDKRTLYFSIGGHPAFNCPMRGGERRSDYHLLFEKEDHLTTHLLLGGLFSGETADIPLVNHQLAITDHLFDNDALVLKHPESASISLVGPSGKWLTFHFAGFPYLGIWSKSRTSPFLCLEPWFGLADYAGHDQDLFTKEGICALAPGEQFHCMYGIQIH